VSTNPSKHYGLGNSEDAGNVAEFLLPEAQNGDPFIQNDLGLLYRDGIGLDQNSEEAFKWISKAAEQGNIDAQVKVGFMYQNGVGVLQNSRTAIEWWKPDVTSRFNRNIANGRRSVTSGVTLALIQ
jgi:TPR repeat protein